MAKNIVHDPLDALGERLAQAGIAQWKVAEPGVKQVTAGLAYAGGKVIRVFGKVRHLAMPGIREVAVTTSRKLKDGGVISEETEGPTADVLTAAAATFLVPVLVKRVDDVIEAAVDIIVS